MSISRTKSRIHAMTVLYQLDLYKKNKINYDLNEVINSNEFSDDEFAIEIINGVINNIDDLDNLANKYLNNWSIYRLGLTDAAIIRIALYELLYTDTPNKVIINEAIELSKDYSDDKVVKMINGVLDKVYHNECSNR